MNLLAQQLIAPGDPILETPKRREAPCEKRLRDHLAMMEVIYLQTRSVPWQVLGEICKRDYWAYLRLILQFRWCDPWWHGETIAKFVQEITDNNEDGIIIVPRDSGKSTIITVPYPGWQSARDPFTRMTLSNATEDKAKKMSRASMKIIEKNQRYRLCYPYVKPDEIKWGEDGYFLNLDELTGGDHIERIDPTLKPYGVRGNITGTHVEKQLHDDLINIETYRSPVELKRVEAFFDEALRCLVASGSFLVQCTRWTYLDPYGRIESGEIQGHRGPARVLKHGIYKEDGELCWPQRTFIDLQGNARTAGYTREQIENFRKKPLFSALYLCEPVANEDIAFDIHAIQRYEQRGFGIRPATAIGVEGEGPGIGFVSSVRTAMQEQNKSFRLDTLTTKKVKKDVRIRTVLQPLISEGRLYVLESDWRGPLGDELRMFDKGTDDLLDALANCVKNAKKPGAGESPQPYIAVDPAFTANSDSDFTAIVVGCWYNDNFWVLETKRFKTDRADFIIRMIFRLFDFYNKGYKPTEIQNPVHVGVISNPNHPQFYAPRQGNFNSGFHVEMPWMKKQPEHEEF